jgi:hypothetical protein
MESEGISEDEFSDCSYPERYTSTGGDDWSIVPTSIRACVLTIVVDKLAKENWRLISEPQYWENRYGAITFTRTTYT